MRLPRQWMALIAATAIVGCGENDPVATDELLSTIRYYNALPDTSRVTVRPIDLVEAHTVAPQLAFRDSSGTYVRTHDGTRLFVAFYGEITNPSAAATPPELASIRVLESTVDLQAGGRHTAWLIGFARAGSTPQKELFITEDNPPAVTSGWAARALNVAAGAGAVDVYVYTGATVPATPTFSGVQYKQATNYVTFSTGTGYTVRVCPAGAANNAATCGTRTVSAGTAGSASGNLQDPVAGSNIAGSVFTIAVMPPIVANSTATCGTGAGTCGTIFPKFAVDQRPPRTGP